MKNLIIAFLIGLLTAGTGLSQQNDRMMKEIEVAENVLSSIMAETLGEYTGNRFFFGRSKSVEGSYLDDFGVLFTIAPSALGGMVWDGSSYFVTPNDKARIIIKDEIRKKFEGADVEVLDEAALEIKFKEMATNFFADYGYLLKQLPENERVMLRYANQLGDLEDYNKEVNVLRFGSAISIERDGPRTIFSAIAQKKDINAFEKASITRKVLQDRIDFTFEKEENGGKHKNLSLLSSIFKRLYSGDFDDLFRIKGNPSYERIEGIGAVMHLSFGSHLWPAIAGMKGSMIWTKELGKYEELALQEYENAKEKTNKEQAVKAKSWDEHYPEFLATLKENIVEYGSIVKDLEAGESLIIKVKFSSCKECKVRPDYQEVNVNQQTLSQYRAGKISLEQAVKALKVS